MHRASAIALAILVAIALCPAAVVAQSTGSSFGGSSFGSGGSRSSSSGSRSSSSGSRRSSSSGSSFGSSSSGSRRSSATSSSSSSSSSSSGSSSSSRRPNRPRYVEPSRSMTTRDWGVLGFIVVVALGGFLFLRMNKRRGSSSATGPAAPPATPPAVVPDKFSEPVFASALVDVSAITLAVDWRDRRALQAKLEALAKNGDTSSPQGLARLLSEVAIELRRVEQSWLYAGTKSFEPVPEARAEERFRSIAQDMRSRYRTEVVRSADGATVEGTAPELRARPEEGEGVVAVTLVVAARGEIPDVAQARDADGLRQLLSSLGAIGGSRLIALEVVWSPSTENDRMSTAELEVLYPELEKIDERSIAGRVFCQYCRYPYAAELSKCPQCGAPSAGV